MKVIEAAKVTEAVTCGNLRHLASNSRAIRSKPPQIAKIAT